MRRKLMKLLGVAAVFGPCWATGAQANFPEETLSLPEAALIALRHHPELKIAEAQIDQAQAAMRIASAPFYPTLRGHASFSYSEAQDAEVGGQNVLVAGGVRNYRTGLSASQLITDFGKTRSNLDSAAASKDVALWQRQEAVQALLLRVAESYFGVLRTRAEAEIARANVANAQAQVARARGFTDLGLRAPIEVTRAEADLATAQVALIAAQNNERKAMNSLLTQLATPSTQPVQVLDSELKAPTWELAEVVHKATESRPDLRAAFARVEAAEARLRNARAQYYPSLSASYNYDWSEDRFLPRPYNWNVGLSLSFPLFDEPAVGAGVQAAQAQRVQAEGEQELLALQIRQQASEAWLNLQEARARLEALRVSLRTHEDNYWLASERYRVGVGSSLEVSDAYRLLVQARSQQAQALFDVQLAIARLYRQTGSLTLENLLS